MDISLSKISRSPLPCRAAEAPPSLIIIAIASAIWSISSVFNPRKLPPEFQDVHHLSQNGDFGVVWNGILIAGNVGRNPEVFSTAFPVDHSGQIYEHEVIVCSTGYDLNSTIHQSLAECLCVVNNILLVNLKFQPQCLLEADCLGPDHMHQWSALNTREDCFVKVILVRNFLTAQNPFRLSVRAVSCVLWSSQRVHMELGLDEVLPPQVLQYAPYQPWALHHTCLRSHGISWNQWFLA